MIREKQQQPPSELNLYFEVSLFRGYILQHCCRYPYLPLLGFTHWVSPLHRSNLATVHSQNAETFFRRAAAIQPACSVLMLSQHLDGLLQLPTSGLLHPDVDHGVRYVSKLLHRRKRRVPIFFPATRFIPPEEFPLLVAVPHRCGPYLLAVTSHLIPSRPPK